jgi:glycosyltransferase involved in cell wall biosynthesis
MPSPPEGSLAFVVLTLNEGRNLRRCLESATPLHCPIYVVDSGSTDETLQIATTCGAMVMLHPFENHTAQWNWAIASLPRRYSWVLGLDADQALTPELVREIQHALAQTVPGGPLENVNGFFINRRHIFRGKWLRWGGLYPKYLLKLFRPESLYFDENERLDHHFYVHGRTRKLTAEIVEENVNEQDILFWCGKHIRYASRLAEEETLRRQRRVPDANGLTWLLNPQQQILFLKHVWLHCPLYFRPIVYFLYRYVFRLGFLDGKQGFVFHCLQALWFRLLVDIAIDDARKMSVRTARTALHE